MFMQQTLGTWNIFDAMHKCCPTSWEFTVPAVIQNGFANCGFGTLSEVSTEEDEGNEWV